MCHLRTINRVALRLSLLFPSSRVRLFAVNNLPQIKSHENGVYVDVMLNFVKISQLLHEVTGTHVHIS
jgi:hypothetical protein